ncbi:MAG: protein-disulfide reductase DsbD domain-containing protein [Acidobacteriota bacterium]
MLRCLTLVVLASSLSFAQSKALVQGRTETVKAKIGSTVEVKVPFELREGFHVNSNTPLDKTLIPLKMTWKDGILGAQAVTFPKPVMGKYKFSKDVLSVFTGNFEVTTKFKVAPTAPPGPTAVNGEVRYQACNDNGCQFPTTVKVVVQVMLVN